jgi:hypothetical protein
VAVRPLTMIAGGLVLVMLDFRTESLDLLADPVGWALVAVGCARLAQRHAASLAGVAAALSLADVALPYRYARIDPLTGDEVRAGEPAGAGVTLHLRFDHVAGWRLAAMALATAAGALALWTLLRGLERRAVVHDALGTAGSLRTARWLAVGVWAAPPLAAAAAAVAGSGRLDPVWNGPAELVGLAGLAALAAVAFLLVRDGNAAWALADDAWRPSPWDQLRLRRAAGGPPDR